MTLRTGGGRACWHSLPPAVQRVGGDGLRHLAGWLAVGVHRAVRRPLAGSFGLLLYHRVAPPVEGLPAPSMNVPPRQLERQLAGLLEQGYQPWPLTRLLDWQRQGRTVPARTFCVTFDDGFESVYVHAWSIVERLRVPVTIFLSTGFVDGEQPFFFDDWALRYRPRVPAASYRPLRGWQCRDMADSPLVSFGTHGHRHLDCRGRPDTFEADLEESLRALRTLLGKRATSDPVPFAFPFGKPRLGFVQPRLVASARRVGVACGLTTAATPVLRGTDPFAWGRFNVYPHDDARTLAAKLDGCYGWPGLGRWLRPGPGRAP